MSRERRPPLNLQLYDRGDDDDDADEDVEGGGDESKVTSSNTGRRKASRSNQSEAEIVKCRESDRLARETSRGMLAPGETDELRALNTSSRHSKRGKLVPEEKDQLRASNTSSMQTNRGKLEPEEKDQLRASNTSSRQINRGMLERDDTDKLRDSNTSSRQTKRKDLSEGAKKNIRDADSASKKKNKVSNTKVTSVDEMEEQESDNDDIDRLVSSSSVAPNAIHHNKRTTLKDRLFDLSCPQITSEKLQELATTHLRNGRSFLKERSLADKKDAVNSFLTERSRFQWLPTCCICHEQRLSDGIDMKNETSVPRSGHIKTAFPGQPVCKRCKDEKVNVKTKGLALAVHAYSIDANMYPGEVPLVLSRLSKVEVLAISRIHMLSQVIQLRYGVYGFRGNSVYLMNNVLDICNELPRKLDDLNHVWLRLLFPESTFMFHDYVVRRQYVLDAFEFLLNDWIEIPSCRPAGCNLTRNPAYADLTMDNFSQANLDSYPVNGVPPNFQKSITTEEQDLVDNLLQKAMDQKEEAYDSQQQYLNDDTGGDGADDYLNSDDDDIVVEDKTNYSESFLAVNAIPKDSTEVDMIDTILQDRENRESSSQRMSDPLIEPVPSGTSGEESKDVVDPVDARVIIPFRRDKKPVNLNEEFLLAKAWPQLFPYGFGDPTGKGICTHAAPPPLDKCLEHLIWLEGGIFGKNVPFMYATKNIIDIKSASGKAAIYIKKNEEEAEACIEAFKQRYKGALTEAERQIFLGTNARAFQRNCVGSPAYWNSKQKECQAIMDCQDQPFNLFYTYSSAEAYDPVVDRVLSQKLGHPPQDGESKSANNQRKRNNANENPLVVARLYQMRMAALRRFLSKLFGVEVYMDREEMQELRQMVHTHGVGLMRDFADYELLLDVLYSHRSDSKTPEFFALKERVEKIIGEWIEDIDITATTEGLNAPQGRYDRSECITLDIVTFMDNDDETSDCFVKVVHRVQFHKHHAGYCFTQTDVKRDGDVVESSKKRKKSDETNDILVDKSEGTKSSTPPERNDNETRRKVKSSALRNASNNPDSPYSSNSPKGALDTEGSIRDSLQAVLSGDKDNEMDEVNEERHQADDIKNDNCTSRSLLNNKKKQKLTEAQPGDDCCRFNLPAAPRVRTSVRINEKGTFTITVKRSEGMEMMIPTNKELCLTAQSNHCVVIVLNRNKCQDYICKYSFKSEKTKKKTNEMLLNLLKSDALSTMQVTRKLFMEYLSRDQGPCSIAMSAANMPFTHTSERFVTLTLENKEVLLTLDGKESTQSAMVLYGKRPAALLAVTLHQLARCYTKKYELLPLDQLVTPVCYSFYSVYNPRKAITHEHWCKCVCKMHFAYPEGIKELLPIHINPRALNWIDAWKTFKDNKALPLSVSRAVMHYKRKISGKLFYKEDDPHYNDGSDEMYLEDHGGESGGSEDDSDDEDDDGDVDDDDDIFDGKKKARARSSRNNTSKGLFDNNNDTGQGQLISGTNTEMMPFTRQVRNYDHCAANHSQSGASFGGNDFDAEDDEDANDEHDRWMQRIQTSDKQRGLEKYNRDRYPQSILEVCDWEKSVLEYHANAEKETCVDSDKVLNDGQQKVYDFHQALIEEQLENSDDFHGNVSIINGMAGVGKTVLINKICTLYNEKYIEQVSHGQAIVGIIAPTATAATLIGGTTIHNFIRCGIGDYQDLEGKELQEFQQKWKDLKVIVGDERGMWGKKISSYLLRRIEQVNPAKNHLTFGGINLILAGDNGQLGPVKDNPLWLQPPQPDLSFKRKRGAEIPAVDVANNKLATDFYAAIKKVFFLTRVQRMVDRSVFNYLGDEVLIDEAFKKEALFQKMLPEIRNGEVSRESFDLLATRSTANQTRDELAAFREDAVNIVLSNKVANGRNREGLSRDVALPNSHGYVKVSAEHVGGDDATRRAAERMSGKDSGGIENTIAFVEGTPVLYRRNFSVAAKIVNGSSGKFRAIVRDVNNQDYVDNKLKEAPILFVLIEFPNYEGPVFSPHVGEEKYVPVLFKEGDVLVKKKAVDGSKKISLDRITRRGLPLMLAYAITVHRCQGMTIRKGILDLEKREFCAGLTFTALSRFASLFHFLIESSCFYEKRFEGLRSYQMLHRIAEDARLLMLSDPANEDYEALWQKALTTAKNTTKSKLKWRIKGDSRLKEPTSSSKRGKKRGNNDMDTDEDDDDDDDDDGGGGGGGGDSNDVEYSKKISKADSRNQARVAKQHHEQALVAQANEVSMHADRVLIYVPNLPLLGTDLLDYSGKKWCLLPDSLQFMNELRLLIATHRAQRTSNNDMYFDEFSINFVTFEQMQVFFCKSYLYGTSIDYFLSLTLRHRHISVHCRNAQQDMIPNLVNDHHLPVSTKKMIYLPTSFYETLAGPSTQAISNDYNYVRCNNADFTSKYTNNEYLVNDIVTVFHRPNHWEMMILLPSKKCVVLIDPFHLDRQSDVTTNFLRWYQNEAVNRFPNDPVFVGLDTSTWRVIVASRNSYNSIYTPRQTDGWSCGVLCSMMAYHYMMYGSLPTNDFFTCAEAHVKQMRFFMIFEIARLSSLPCEWTEQERALYNGSVQRRLANQAVRRQRAEAQRVFNFINNVDNNHLVGELIELDEEFAERVAQLPVTNLISPSL